MNDDKFKDAEIHLADGRIAYDAVKLAQLPTEGLFVAEYPKHVILVRTRNTLYQFFTYGSTVIGLASKEDGSTPDYLPSKAKVNILGSTWGGSMIKVGYIGVGMYLEFTTYEGLAKSVRTSVIENIRVVERDGNDA